MYRREEVVAWKGDQALAPTSAPAALAKERGFLTSEADAGEGAPLGAEGADLAAATRTVSSSEEMSD